MGRLAGSSRQIKTGTPIRSVSDVVPKVERLAMGVARVVVAPPSAGGYGSRGANTFRRPGRSPVAVVSVQPGGGKALPFRQRAMLIWRSRRSKVGLGVSNATHRSFGFTHRHRRRRSASAQPGRRSRGRQSHAVGSPANSVTHPTSSVAT